MSFWNEGVYFERRGDRFVYRATLLSPGFDISASEKDSLFRALARLQWRTLAEGLGLVAAIAVLFMSGVTGVQQPIPWFLICGIGGIAVLALSVLRRRDRLIVRVLGRRTPDLPRWPLRQAMAKPQPLVSKRYGIPVLRSVIVLFACAMAAGDGLATYVVLAAYRARWVAQWPEDMTAADELLSLTVGEAWFWVALALFNAILFAAAFAMHRSVRRLRVNPSIK